MPEFRQIAVHVGDNQHADQLIEQAAQMAALHQAHLNVVFAVEPTPVLPSYPAGDMTETNLISIELDRSRRNRACARVAQLRHRTGMALPLLVDQTNPLSALASQSRRHDLLILGQFDPNQPDGTTPSLRSRIALQSSCPVLLLPYATPHDDGQTTTSTRSPIGHRVLVAWQDSREAARALREALPILKRAGAVELLHVGSPEPSQQEAMNHVQQYLRAHGVEAQCHVIPNAHHGLDEHNLSSTGPDASVGELLLSRASDIDADVIVMGCYGHTRLWELALGGVTRTLLNTMTVPVLLSH